MCEHVALILDGNRRWGKRNNVAMCKAYKKGAETLQEIVLELINLQIPLATIYGFSFENWNRSLYDISIIMISFLSFLEHNRDFFIHNNIRVKFIGDLGFFDEKVEAVLMELEELTKNHTAILIQLAISYSGRNEILNAIEISKSNSELFENCLYTKSSPDLLIRTGGCKRLSNFLLWQVAYTELYFLDKLWPDFTKDDLRQVLEEYSKVSHNKGV